MAPVGRLLLVLSLLPSLLVAACSGDAREERKTIHDVHFSAVAAVIHEDMSRHREGIREAAERLAPGFAVEDPAVRERQMRTALRYVQEPPRGVPEFIASPMSFLAAIGPDGVVIARDTMNPDDDQMKGQNFGERYALVRRGLEEGRGGRELVEFPATEEGGESSWSMLFVQPVRHRGRRVGVVAAGIPLWRWSQRLSRQLQVENADQAGIVLWVYMYRADRLFHFGTSELLDPLIPDVTVRREGLARSPGGFTGEFQMNTRWYAYGVLPVPSIGEDVGIIIVRSNPM
jgi:hypothetical protein